MAANISGKIGYFVLRRMNSTVAREVTATAKKSEAVRAATESAKDVVWMRDPKTGNWMPENHFEQVDPLDLRIKFLSSHATKN